jgi:hypothetical protein
VLPTRAGRVRNSSGLSPVCARIRAKERGTRCVEVGQRASRVGPPGLRRAHAL